MYKTDNSWVKSQMMIEAEMKAADSENKMDGEYMVGAVKCTVQRTKAATGAAEMRRSGKLLGY
jgi:hypothetical protein